MVRWQYCVKSEEKMHVTEKAVENSTGRAIQET